jgi:hypothetical protein
MKAVREFIHLSFTPGQSLFMRTDGGLSLLQLVFQRLELQYTR